MRRTVLIMFSCGFFAFGETQAEALSPEPIKLSNSELDMITAGDWKYYAGEALGFIFRNLDSLIDGAGSARSSLSITNWIDRVRDPYEPVMEEFYRQVDDPTYSPPDRALEDLYQRNARQYARDFADGVDEVSGYPGVFGPSGAFPPSLIVPGPDQNGTNAPSNPPVENNTNSSEPSQTVSGIQISVRQRW